MENPSSCNTPNFASSKRPQRFFTWRLLGRVLLVTAILATLIALFYAEEDWRGRHAWEKYKREAEARGMNFDWDKLIPPSVPDDQNFAMTPFLKPLLDLNPRPFNGQMYRDTNGVNRANEFANDLLKVYDAPLSLYNTYPFKPADLTNAAVRLKNSPPPHPKNRKGPQAPPAQPMTRVEAAGFLLEHMKQYQPVLDEIRAASKRPYSRFNVHYDDADPAGILLPHLAMVKKLSVLFQIEGSCSLALGKTDVAAQDVEQIFHLADSVRDEPFMISYLVRIAIFNIGEEIIWDGLARHQWSDGQLQSFQNQLQKLSLVQDGRRSLESERTGFGDKLFSLVREHPRYLMELGSYASSGGPSADVVLLCYAPKGWFYLEQLNQQLIFDEKFMPAFDKDATRVFPEFVDRTAADFQKFLPPNAYRYPMIDNQQVPDAAYRAPGALWRLLHHQVLETFFGSSSLTYFKKPALAQTEVNQAIIACALERYHMANGNYPETVDALVPKFMEKAPLDVCNGEPMKYRRTDKGQFELYSVGWNCKDDGGVASLSKENATKTDITQGDWVWPDY